MSETPRTDALQIEINEGRVYATDGPTVELCRQLERELADANRRLDVYAEVNATLTADLLRAKARGE